MDEKQSGSNRGTGIPRLSRLPVLRSTPSVSSLKTAPSRESLTSQVPKPRLRTAPSRDQLPKATTRTIETEKTAAPARPIPRRSLPGPRPPNPASQHATALRKPKPLSRQASDLDLTRSQSSATVSTETASTESTSPELSEKLPFEIDGSGYDTLRPRSSRPRPSLSERTMETLAQLPSSPALSKKSSSFFDPDGTKRPRSRAGSSNSRPGSSYTSDGSMRPPSQGRISRPGSSSSGHDDCGLPNFRASTNSFRTPLDTIHGTPSRRTSGIASLRTPNLKATPRLGAGQFSASTMSQPPNSGVATPSKPGSKTVSARPLKPRTSVQGLFKKPSIANLEKSAAPVAPRTPAKPAARTPSGVKPTRPGNTQPPISTSSGDDGSETKEAPHLKASIALREQIAKAKAAKRAAAARQATEELTIDVEPAAEPSESPVRRRLPPKSPIVPQDDSFDFGLDPFNTKRSEDSAKKILQQRLGDARSSGRLNIAALGFKSIPPEVLKMYDSESMGTYDGSWAETVDLTRFVAADNELESIDDSIFPDVPLEQLAEDEDSAGNIFGGLENLDLHGNLLIAVPMGLRQLPQLTTLNLVSYCVSRVAFSSVLILP